MSIHKKLMEARLRLQAMPVKKGGENTFAKYKYLELADFLPATQQIFSDLGLCGVVSFTADIASLTITDTEDGTSLTITSPMGSAALKGCHEVQNIGAVETYQRRYLWVTAMEIVEHDALDSAPPAERVEQTNERDPWQGFTPDQAKKIRLTAQECIRAFTEGREFDAYGSYTAMLDRASSVDARLRIQLALSSAFQPHSALRSCLKRFEDEERNGPRPEVAKVEKMAPGPGLKKIGVRATTEEQT